MFVPFSDVKEGDLIQVFWDDAVNINTKVLCQHDKETFGLIRVVDVGIFINVGGGALRMGSTATEQPVRFISVSSIPLSSVVSYRLLRLGDLRELV